MSEVLSSSPASAPPPPPPPAVSPPAVSPSAETPGDVIRLALFRDRRGLLLLGGAAGLSGHQIGEALVPVAIGWAIDSGIVAGDTGGFLRDLALLALLFAGLTFSWRFGYTCLTRATLYGAHALRQRVVGRALHPGGAAERRAPGVTTAIATSDTGRVGGFCWTVSELVSVLAAIVTSAVALLAISPALGLIVLLATPLSLLLMQLVSRPLERRSGAEQAAAATAEGLATEFVSGVRVLKGVGAEDEAARRYATASRRSLEAAVRAISAKAGYYGVSVVFSALLTSVIALVSGLRALDGEIGVGQLVAVVGLAQFIQQPMARLGVFGIELAQKRASARRIADQLTTPPAVPVHHQATDARPSSDEERPPAGAPLTSEPAPERASEPGPEPAPALRITPGPETRWPALTVAAGQRVGLVHDSPDEAAALVAILARRAPVEPGRFAVGGTELATLDPETARARHVHAQGGWARVLPDTLHDNVVLDAPLDADTLAATAVDEVAGLLPDGYAERLTSGGATLSGGQRQRILLARALHTSQPLLVLHDPTTALDAVTESEVAGGLAGVTGRAVLLVTTSPALLAVCDTVAARIDGAWTVAPHPRLLTESAAYRELIGA
ncbi:ATP-binding cassette domain-containing protein [Streptomyces sp. 3MP-14]|uniref:ATP-binding cassette domain-containing protein n=1 Tax=Streptomyces mimosae TaxID=2586635 RepID=A0A5N6AA61_9ACTN|nr:MULTISPECIES: ABC transporter ATP-binding protein [Streptomyces]KAB8164640.1 ATP-binding cassette domain-containing protein [Streptomyces mimosae]KAB8175556.1 ATP-binding cassette domain-containing protein [Streptomyces sp. 3MP-14]